VLGWINSLPLTYAVFLAGFLMPRSRLGGDGFGVLLGRARLGREGLEVDFFWVIASLEVALRDRLLCPCPWLAVQALVQVLELASSAYRTFPARFPQSGRLVRGTRSP
jgi:hypothetical protein